MCRIPFTKLGLLVFPILAACQTGNPAETLSINTKQKPVDAVASIARVAQECWFKSKDSAFRDMRMSNEVNSYAGRPRFLIVRKSDPNGLPMLVVQAERKGETSTGHFTNIQTYGPLLQTRSGERITGDVRRWSRGNTTCA